MPKAKNKSQSKKRTVTCSVCKEEGHNARTCSDNKKGTDAEQVAAPESHLPKPEGDQTRRRIDYREEEPPRQNVVPRRDAPTQGPFSSEGVSPFRCEKCQSVAVLVAVRVKDHNESFKKKREIFKSEIRCEKCFNKPQPSDLILKWGVLPGEDIPVSNQDDDA